MGEECPLGCPSVDSLLGPGGCPESPARRPRSTLRLGVAGVAGVLQSFLEEVFIANTTARVMP